jgi:hypothetical protein
MTSAEPLMPYQRVFDFEMVNENLKEHKLLGVYRISVEVIKAWGKKFSL